MSANYSSALEVFAELLTTKYNLVSSPTPAFFAAGEWIRASSAGSECRSETANVIYRPFDPVARAAEGTVPGSFDPLGPPDRCDK